MARIAAADGIEVIACTPHIMPGVYDNTGPKIAAASRQLADALKDAGIALDLVCGADIHAAPDVLVGLREGRLLTLNNTRYFLLEPPHHVLPPRLAEFAHRLIAAGFAPILTHPERLSWIDLHYDVVRRLGDEGVLMQLTAGSLTGRFGRKPRYWAERMLDEGQVHLVATDAHDDRRRPPLLAEARDVVVHRLGTSAANQLVVENPHAILQNVIRSNLLPLAAQRGGENIGFWRWAWGLRAWGLPKR